MAQSYDPYHLASPVVYLVKIVIFLIIIAFVGLIISSQAITFYWANPFINSLILLVMATGIFLSFRQIIRLFPEVKWLNSLQDGGLQDGRPPVLLAPVAGILRDRIGESVITPSSMRSILDSVGNRLDEAKDTSRYLTGLLVFLGLLGTFYGLLQTVTSVATVIQGLDATQGDTATLFTNLKEGLIQPLGGMGTAFSVALRPFRVVDPRLSRSPDQPGPERLFHRPRGLDDLDDRTRSPGHRAAGFGARRLGWRNAGHVRAAGQHHAALRFVPERYPCHG
jgi:hypothetical protein